MSFLIQAETPRGFLERPGPGRLLAQGPEGGSGGSLGAGAKADGASGPPLGVDGEAQVPAGRPGPRSPHSCCHRPGPPSRGQDPHPAGPTERDPGGAGGPPERGPPISHRKPRAGRADGGRGRVTYGLDVLILQTELPVLGADLVPLLVHHLLQLLHDLPLPLRHAWPRGGGRGRDPQVSRLPAPLAPRGGVLLRRNRPPGSSRLHLSTRPPQAHARPGWPPQLYPRCPRCPSSWPPAAAGPLGLLRLQLKRHLPVEALPPPSPRLLSSPLFTVTE